MSQEPARERSKQLGQTKPEREMIIVAQPTTIDLRCFDGIYCTRLGVDVDLVKDVPIAGFFQLSLMKCHRDREPFIHVRCMLDRGEEMLGTGQSLAGQRHAEALIVNQSKIPVEWRDFQLVFATLWGDAESGEGYWFETLEWSDENERWGLDFYRLHANLYRDARLVCVSPIKQ